MAAVPVVPFGDVRAAIALARREGERLADAALRDIEARGAQVVASVERQLGKASTLVLRRFSAATQREIDALDRRVATLEKRLRSLERRRRAKARRAAE